MSPAHCPKCSCNCYAADSRTSTDLGTVKKLWAVALAPLLSQIPYRRRRYHCECGYRWTTLEFREPDLSSRLLDTPNH